MVIEPILTMNLRTSALFLSLAALAAPALSQDVLQPGFQAQVLQLPNGASSRTLTTGDIITVDGVGVDRWLPDGTFVQNLGTFPAALFGGAFDIDPTETFAIVGRTDSSTTPNPVFKVMLDGSGMTQLADVVFNYDGAFAPDGTYYLSAAIGGFGAGNSLLRLDTTTGVVTELAQLSGASGPVAVDAQGNLFYATVSDLFPAPAASTDVLIFQAADLAAADCATGPCLSDASAISYATGYDGAGGLVIDWRTGTAYMIENNFSSGANRVWAVTGGAASGPPLVEGVPFQWISNLEVHAGGALPELRAYQPVADARLLYTNTDWATFTNRNEVTAARATLALSGPGLTGPGVVDLTVTGGEPGGSALVLFGPTSLVSPTEGALVLPGVDPFLFTALDPASVLTFGGALPLDGAGSAGLTFANPGGLEGLVTIQGLLIDLQGISVLGTTTAAPF